VIISSGKTAAKHSPPTEGWISK